MLNRYVFKIVLPNSAQHLQAQEATVATAAFLEPSKNADGIRKRRIIFQRMIASHPVREHTLG